ncbi:lengsin isoform X1 [Chiloscyllium punctatum]|uniref:lengsin isoform X1 n=2 Tax=Chiloscyllium punctatum TaxID=137246 RepID=UPI003B63FFC3
MEEMQEEDNILKVTVSYKEANDGTDVIDGSGISFTHQKRGVRVSGKFMPPLDWERVERKYTSRSTGHSYLPRTDLSSVSGVQLYKPMTDEQCEDRKYIQYGGDSQKQEENNTEDWETNNEDKAQSITVSKVGISKETMDELKAVLKESPLITSRQKVNNITSCSTSDLNVQSPEEKPRDEEGKSSTILKAQSSSPRELTAQVPSKKVAGDEMPKQVVATSNIQKSENIKPIILKTMELPSHTDSGLDSKHDPSSNVKVNMRDLPMLNSVTPSQTSTTIEQAKQQITREDIRFIRFEASDFHGISRSKTIPSRFFQEKVFHGVPLPRGYLEVALDPKENGMNHPNFNSDILLMPDISTFRILPWADKTARIICDACSITGSPLLTSPRQIAKLQLNHLRAYGFTLYSSFTYEFWLYSFTQILNTPASFPAATLLNNHDQNFVQELFNDMYGAGVDIESFSSSSGPGQMEVSLRAEFGMSAVDNAFTFRTGVKELARKHNNAASFFTPSGFGNSGTFSHSLWDANGRQNLFSDPTAAQELSGIGKRWQAGLAQHAAALSCLVAPGPCCRQRYSAGKHEGVVDVTCGSNDNSCAINTKFHGGGGARLENRLASAMANPYIVLAATVAAGLDGLRRGSSESSTQGAPILHPLKPCSIPVRLEDALIELEHDYCIRRALGEPFIQHFIAVKQFELKTQALDGENEKYLEYFI